MEASHSQTQNGVHFVSGESAAVAAWNRYILAELFYSNLVSPTSINWEVMLEPLEYGIVTDAKSVYDALTSSSGSHGISDKRTAIDLAIIRDHLRKNNGCIRWISGTVQLADSLTKHMTADFIRSVIARGTYQLQEEYSTLNLRAKAKEDRKARKENKSKKEEGM